MKQSFLEQRDTHPQLSGLARYLRCQRGEFFHAAFHCKHAESGLFYHNGAGCTIRRAGSVFRFMSFLPAEKWTGIEEFCRRAFLFEQLVALQGGLEFFGRSERNRSELTGAEVGVSICGALRLETSMHPPK